jgi:hypothetical protein
VKEAGAVFVFRRLGGSGRWYQQATLRASDPSPGSDFGHSVTLDGRTLLVGSPGKSIGTPGPPGSGFVPAAGAAYVFEKHGQQWRQEAKLMPPDPQPGGVFGVSNTLQGGTAIVVSPGKMVDGIPRVGTAYVFTERRGTWAYETRILHSDRAPFDVIHEAELDRGTLMLGAAGKNGDQGALYVFTP